MKIRYLGHSSFALVSDAGKVLITDPFDRTVGYPTPRREADVVTISHAHHDHNCLDTTEARHVFRGLPFSEAGFTGESFLTAHDDANGAKRGVNMLYRVRCDGATVLHLGDLGHRLDAKTVRDIGPVDALLVPVGGYYTIDAKAAWDVTRALKPRVAIPMHYKTPYIDFPIADETEYLRLSGGAHTDRPEIDLSDLPETFAALAMPLWAD